MNKKLYYANVAINMVDYFESKLKEREDSIKVLDKKNGISENNEPVIIYTLEADESVIDSKWELK